MSYLCNSCTRVLSTEEGYRRHVVTMHKDKINTLPVLEFKCDEPGCYASYRFASALSRHRNDHKVETKSLNIQNAVRVKQLEEQIAKTDREKQLENEIEILQKELLTQQTEVERMNYLFYKMLFQKYQVIPVISSSHLDIISESDYLRILQAGDNGPCVYSSHIYYNKDYPERQSFMFYTDPENNSVSAYRFDEPYGPVKVEAMVLVEEVMTSFCLVLEKCITKFNIQVNLFSNSYQQQEKLRSFLNKMNNWKNDRDKQKIDLVKQFILKSANSARFLPTN